MRKISTKVLFIALAGSFIFTACDLPKKRAVGKEDRIIVIADSVEYTNFDTVLESVFGKIIYTPQPESVFILDRKDLAELDKHQDKKNIIIIAPLNSGSNVSNYISSLLDSSVKVNIMEDSAFVINRYDVWARDQLVMILTSPTIEQLNKNILNKADDLIYNFQKISNKRLFESLYNEKYERKDIEAKLLQEYGWMIYVQADYELAKNVPEDNFVWLRRGISTSMERWIFVHWIDNASPEFLTEDSVLAERDSITKKHYQTISEDAYVEIDRRYTAVSEVNFLGKYALMTQGLWRFNDKSGGGPFVNYTFYDEKSGRIYMLDGAIFAPKHRKKGLIQQVDVTLQSFMTASEVSEEKKKELKEIYDEYYTVK